MERECRICGKILSEEYELKKGICKFCMWKDLVKLAKKKFPHMVVWCKKNKRYYTINEFELFCERCLDCDYFIMNDGFCDPI